MIEAIITGIVAIIVCVINNAIIHRSNKIGNLFIGMALRKPRATPTY